MTRFQSLVTPNVKASAFALLVVVASCGRTELSGSFDDEPVTSGAGPTQGGSLAVAGKQSSGAGGTPGKSGAAGGGAFGTGGTFGIAGSGGFAMAGAALGGEPSSQECQLAVGDCRLATQPECAPRPLCDGALQSHQVFGMGELAIADIATSTSGRVAIAGYFTGSADFGGKSQPLASVDATDSGATDAFVAVLDPSGAAEWAYAYTGDGWQAATGVRFTPNGDVVVQGSSLEGSLNQPDAQAPGVFVLRLDATGKLIWSERGGTHRVHPSRLAVDNNGGVVLSGYYESPVQLFEAYLGHSGSIGYLLWLDGDGKVTQASDVGPSFWRSSYINDIAIDDEDNIVLVGGGQNGSGNFATYARKQRQNGDVVFTQEFLAAGGMQLPAVAVDRKMRVVVLGQFGGHFENAGEDFQSASPAGSDVWLACYSGEGALEWQTAFSSDGTGASARTVATDPFDNIVVAAAAGRLEAFGSTLAPAPEHRKQALFVLKLRRDGSSVWARAFDGATAFGGLATTNRGAIWLAGDFLDELWLGSDVVHSQGQRDGYLLELNP